MICGMEWLNYHHLLYFWVVAREGSIARASEQLHLTQATISGQIRTLEEVLGEKLFSRPGRNLVLTDVGRMVLRYADEIFTLGRELMDTLKGRPTGRPVRLVVGVVDVLPKLIAHRLLEPAFELVEPVRVICREGKHDHLVAQLAVHELDLVLTDAPIGSTVKVRAFNHLLGECGVTIFGSAPLVAKYRRSFPRLLNGAPFLLPTDNTTLRRSLDQWFEAEGIRPTVVGEFEDSALLKVLGQSGKGLFAAPSVIEAEVRSQYRVQVVGRVEAVRERFYAISVERKLKNPAAVAISEAARQKLFD
jgi:LysR family transcriptional activator of nhaA